MALGRELLAELRPGSPGFDELGWEVATAMNDLRQAAIAGKFADEIDDLQTEVVALCEAHPGPRARQALAQAIHNEAVDMTGLAYQAMYQRIEPDPAAVARLLSLCDRAIQLRQGLGAQRRAAPRGRGPDDARGRAGLPDGGGRRQVALPVRRAILTAPPLSRRGGSAGPPGPRRPAPARGAGGPCGAGR